MRITVTNTATLFSGFNMKICAFVLASIAVSSCWHRKEQLLHEKGIVVEKHYIPGMDQYSSGYSASRKKKYKNTGVDAEKTETKSKYSEDVVHQPSQYIVIFRCGHNAVFAINRLSLYGKLNEGDSVDLDYYEWLDKANKVQYYELVDANPLIKTR